VKLWPRVRCLVFFWLTVYNAPEPTRSEATVWDGTRLHLPLYCVTRKFGFLQNRGIFLWSSALSQTLDLAIFCHGKSINRTFRQSSSLPQWLDGPGTKSAVYDRPPYSLLHCFPVGRRLIRYSFDQSLIWSACVAWDDVLAWTIARTCWSTFQLQSLSQQSVQIPPDSDTRTMYDSHDPAYIRHPDQVQCV